MNAQGLKQQTGPHTGVQQLLLCTCSKEAEYSHGLRNVSLSGSLTRQLLLELFSFYWSTLSNFNVMVFLLSCYFIFDKKIECFL